MKTRKNIRALSIIIFDRNDILILRQVRIVFDNRIFFCNNKKGQVFIYYRFRNNVGDVTSNSQMTKMKPIT